MIVNEIQERLQELGNAEKARILRRFFKTGPGEYGEGDLFRGITVPVLRKFAKEYQAVSLPDTVKLLESSFHEDRMLALILLVRAYSKANDGAREEIYNVYLENTRFIDNWDLVDTSAEHIVGGFLADKPREPLYRLAGSKDLWERRIAILATFHFIKRGEFGETLRLSERLLSDPEDLIHKAVGWMLREVGKRDLQAEEGFLKRHYRKMPRTMLRYAIEKFAEDRRQKYLKGEI